MDLFNDSSGGIYCSDIASEAGCRGLKKTSNTTSRKILCSMTINAHIET